MIGIVVVSHSEPLARAAVDLALEMVPGERPAIALAAGAGEGIIGTDATRVAAAIEEVASDEGVLVIMDLGSALLSTEMALEFLPADAPRVKLTSAPFVEGLLAAIVRAAGGASLDEVESEARGALLAKSSQLDDEDAPTALPAAPSTAAPGASVPAADVPDAASPEASVTLELINPSGMHTRPAAMVVAAVVGRDARVTISNVETGAGPARADSPIALLTLGAPQGSRIRIDATGPEAAEAVQAVAGLVRDGFGELDEAATDVSSTD